MQTNFVLGLHKSNSDINQFQEGSTKKLASTELFRVSSTRDEPLIDQFPDSQPKILILTNFVSARLKNYHHPLVTIKRQTKKDLGK